MSTNSATTEESRRVVTAMYDAALQGNFAGLMERLDENVVVYEPPFLPYAGTYRGHAEFLGIVDGINACGDLARLKLNYIVADGEKVFGVLEIPDKKNPAVPFLIAEESTVRGGKVVEIRVFYFNAGSMIPGSK